MIINSREQLEQLQADGELGTDDADEVRTFMDFLEDCGPARGKPGHDPRRVREAYAKYYPEDYATAVAAHQPTTEKENH